MRETQVLFHLSDRKCPGVVGHRHPVAGNRACDGDTTFVDRYLVLLEIDAHPPGPQRQAQRRTQQTRSNDEDRPRRLHDARTDAIVVPTTTRPDHAESARLLLAELGLALLLRGNRKNWERRRELKRLRRVEAERARHAGPSATPAPAAEKPAAEEPAAEEPAAEAQGTPTVEETPTPELEAPAEQAEASADVEQPAEAAPAAEAAEPEAPKPSTGVAPDGPKMSWE